jgi:hypothetical protein
MAITEEARHQLYLRLEAALGREEATTFMEHMPPVGWADVATKHDLEQQTLLTKRDIELAASELRREIAGLRGEFGELRGEFGGLRGEFGELRGEFGELRGEFGDLRAELHRELRMQTFALLGAGSVLFGLFSVLSRTLG